ncbi:MAG: biotin--[acetyl-CoA-carboxylase] ligase [Cardiobacteriaceae bacterium]|nr:biotin--[acetyl-CoA-carboxylase] ligase [Cardiobacteriaceae bacterium]
MATSWQSRFKALYHFDTLDSTQTFLHRHPFMGAVFCRADTQTHGKGQRERLWQSPRGQLYLSFHYVMPNDYADLQGITQALALSLVQTLDPQAQYLKLKWPNDVYFQGQKLAGLLVESKKVDKALCLTIGLGLNLMAHQREYQAFAGLNQIPSLAHFSLDEVINAIMPALLNCLDAWQQQPYLPITHRWAEYDAFYQKKALCEEVGEVIIWGIDQRGRLQIQREQGMEWLINTRILTSLAEVNDVSVD